MLASLLLLADHIAHQDIKPWSEERGAQTLDAVTHAFLLSLSSDLQLTGAGSTPTHSPFPGSKEATAKMYEALGIVRSLS